MEEYSTVQSSDGEWLAEILPAPYAGLAITLLCLCSAVPEQEPKLVHGMLMLELVADRSSGQLIKHECLPSATITSLQWCHHGCNLRQGRLSREMRAI